MTLQNALPLIGHAPVRALQIEVCQVGYLLVVDLPQLDGFVIGGQQHLDVLGGPAPSRLVDFLLNFQALEVVELRLVRLKLSQVSIFEARAPEGYWCALIHGRVLLRATHTE